jgi:hypothetical protein
VIRSRLSNLPWPKVQYRIDLLMPAVEDKKGFETITQAETEDGLRVKGIRGALRLNSSLIDTVAAEDLAERLLVVGRRTKAPITLASSRYARDGRIRFSGALLAFVENCNDAHLRTVTLLPLAWEFKVHELGRANPKKLLAQLRSTLNRLGAGEADGFLIAVLHGEFEPESQIYRLHVHGVVGGGMVTIVDKLRGLEGYKPRQDVKRPVKLQLLKNPQRQLSYILKSYWPSRRIGPVGPDGHVKKRDRRVHRIKEPYQTQYLLWLDHYELSDIVLMLRCKATSEGISLTNKKARVTYMKNK